MHTVGTQARRDGDLSDRQSNLMCCYKGPDTFLIRIIP
jgi:hypothetical protein